MSSSTWDVVKARNVDLGGIRLEKIKEEQTRASCKLGKREKEKYSGEYLLLGTERRFSEGAVIQEVQ